jgi:hypothetical protein
MADQCIGDVQKNLQEGALNASEAALGLCTSKALGAIDLSSAKPGEAKPDPVKVRTDLWTQIVQGLPEDAKCTLNMVDGAVEVVPNKGRACE